MLDKNQYEKLAEANAKAFQGLNPKITMFNTGPSDSNANPINDIFKMLPMGLMYLQDQLGLKTSEKPAPTNDSKALTTVPETTKE
jgi:flotillin